jgi:hypothetical protein
VPHVYKLWQVRKRIGNCWLGLVQIQAVQQFFMFTTASPALGLKRTGREADQALISV